MLRSTGNIRTLIKQSLQTLVVERFIKLTVMKVVGLLLVLVVIQSMSIHRI